MGERMGERMEEVTAAQAATLTGFSERTIRRKIASGELPARRLAANRFAIDVRDLPRRWNGNEVERRLKALERRVELLEERQWALLQQLGKEECAEYGPVLATAEEQDASISTLHELLVQLAHETERLTPLLTPATPPDEPRARMAGGRRSPTGPQPLRDEPDVRRES